MALHVRKTGAERPLRVLTIDNGGLQAISILCVLKEVCRRLSEEDGHTTPLRPCELFDIIGGIGTGGWLAILLGRYRLRIDECMSVYITIANAVDPTQGRQSGTFVSGLPFALDQNILVDKIDKIVAEHEIGEYMIDDVGETTDLASRTCHAFAVGVVKRQNSGDEQKYRLFRNYKPMSKSEPDPAKCKVSSACAATAAAKDFLDEWRSNIDRVTYWDDAFPRTHNVSCIALDEATAIFGPQRASNLDFVLNISPGIASPDDIQQLKRSATMRSVNGSNKPIWKKAIRAFTDPETYLRHRRPKRQDTSSSTSSEASQKELGHQRVIRDRLEPLAQASGRQDLYFRLEFPSRLKKPYLNDVAKADCALQAAEKFLDDEATKATIIQMVKNAIVRPDDHGIATGRPLYESPKPSFTNFEAIRSH